MLYTVGEVAKKLGVPPSTLRYYDKEGLIPFVERSSGGVRMFKDSDFEGLLVINCLKKTGMPIKDIRDFMSMVLRGDETIGERLELFYKQRAVVEKQIEQLRETLAILNYKCWYYETAQAAGTTDCPEGLEEREIPEEMRPVREKLKNTYAAG